MSAPKLTKAQREVFDELVAKGRFQCVETYAPAKKLIEMGYATRKTGSYGTGWLEPTGQAKARSWDERVKAASRR